MRLLLNISVWNLYLVIQRGILLCFLLRLIHVPICCKMNSWAHNFQAWYSYTMLIFCSWCSLPKYEASHEFQTKRKRQEQRLIEETARKLNLAHPPPHARLPPIQQSGHVFQDRNHSVNQLQHLRPTGPSNLYGNPVVDAGLPNRYPPSANLTAAYNPPLAAPAQASGTSTAPYPHVRPGQYATGNMASRSTATSYPAGPPGFSHRFSNLPSNRNQQFVWQQ